MPRALHTRFHIDGTLPPPQAHASPIVWVFGSNMLGAHAGGAARVAADHFGAAAGVAQGITGSSYAIPTIDRGGRRVPLKQLQQHVDAFLSYARVHPEVVFWLTRVGCGIAGYADLFKRAPTNVDIPEPWRAVHLRLAPGAPCD